MPHLNESVKSKANAYYSLPKTKKAPNDRSFENEFYDFYLIGSGSSSVFTPV